MAHCGVLDVLRQGATVEWRKRVWIGDACRCRDHSLTAQGRRRATSVHVTAVD